MQPDVEVVTGLLNTTVSGDVCRFANLSYLPRQRSRPYLFSNTLAPSIVAGAPRALDLVEGSGQLRQRLRANAVLFRSLMAEAGFDLLPRRASDRAGYVWRRRSDLAGSGRDAEA